MRRNPRPPTRRNVRPTKISIIPFSVDQVATIGDLFRFLVSMDMTLKSALIKVDHMESGPLLLTGSVESTARKFAISIPAKPGLNTLEFNLPVSQGDILTVNFDDKALACQSVTGVTITVCAVR